MKFGAQRWTAGPADSHSTATPPSSNSSLVSAAPLIGAPRSTARRQAPQTGYPPQTSFLVADQAGGPALVEVEAPRAFPTRPDVHVVAMQGTATPAATGLSPLEV